MYIYLTEQNVHIFDYRQDVHLFNYKQNVHVFDYKQLMVWRYILTLSTKKNFQNKLPKSKTLYL